MTNNDRRELATFISMVLKHPAMAPDLKDEIHDIFSRVQPQVDAYSTPKASSFISMPGNGSDRKGNRELRLEKRPGGRGVCFDRGFLEDKPGTVEKIVRREKIAVVQIARPEVVENERLAVDLDLSRQQLAAVSLKCGFCLRRLEKKRSRASSSLLCL